METCRSTYAVCLQAIVEKIPGDFVECGVYAGSQAALMAKVVYDEAHYVHGSELDDEIGNEGIFSTEPMRPYSRCVHLFDSFEGIPEPSSRDEEYIAAGHKKGTAACTLEGVKSNMKQWGIPDELLEYHVGWFKDTMAPFHGQPRVGPAPAHGNIAVLRLDADLYDSTMTCLEHLYPLLSPGAFLIVDDYGLTGARQAVNDYMLSKGGGFGPVYMRKP